MPTLPLSDVTVVDATRMLPGAILARNLLDLGARVIKVEDPRMGDPMRLMPPMFDGMGVGFAAHLRGAWSVGLNLREPDDAAIFRDMIARADVVLESFRPGTLTKWGIDLAAARAARPALITCALPGGPTNASPGVGHDLNYVGQLGVLGHLQAPTGTVPSIQIADITAGLLATSSVLAALFAAARTGVGCHIEQPLATAPLPFVHWSLSESALAGASTGRTVLSGTVPCYRTYPCKGGTVLSVGCLEPKFWVALCGAVGVPEHASAGLDAGARGEAAADAMENALAAHTAQDWVTRLTPHALPVGVVADTDGPEVWAEVERLGAARHLASHDGDASAASVGSFLASALSDAPDRPAPRLDEHRSEVLAWLHGDSA